MDRWHSGKFCDYSTLLHSCSKRGFELTVNNISLATVMINNFGTRELFCYSQLRVI
jgi:hypothetical protein